MDILGGTDVFVLWKYFLHSTSSKYSIQVVPISITNSKPGTVGPSDDSNIKCVCYL